MKRSMLVLGLLLCGAAAPERPAELKVDEVTVFSDRARITRRGLVNVPKGPQTVTLPRLPATIDPASVRLDADGATVVRVGVRRLERGAVPTGEAKALLDRIEALRDEERALEAKRRPLDAERSLVVELRPRGVPLEGSHASPQLLEPAGWMASLDFFAAREKAIADELVAIERRQKAVLDELREALDKADQLRAEVVGEPGYEVEAVVDGGGRPATLALTYMARNARWYPAYDVRFQPDAKKVEIALAGQVEQVTGEDWDGANLVLSTAVPETTADVPKLLVWRIGQKERFTPTPVAVPQPSPWRPTESPPVSLRRAAEDDVSQELWSAVLEGRQRLGQQPTPAPSAQYRPSPAPPPSRPQKQAGSMASRAAKPAPVAQSAPAADEGDYDRPTTMAAPAPPMDVAESLSSGSYRRSVPTTSVGFGAPPSWQPPYFQPDLPAALAGGHTFTYPSARRETVRSGTASVRVGLGSLQLPADSVVKILPALKEQAFVTAEVKNDGARPLLKGPSRLFLGAQMAGEAVVPTTAVGQGFTLPLGIDDAIRVERNVSQSAAQTGFISKKEVTSYLVTIELVNPRAKAVKARVVDQVPLPDGQDVEVKLEKTDPGAKHDTAEGFVTWDVELAPGEKKVLRMTYVMSRPKDSRAWQRTAPAGRQP